MRHSSARARVGEMFENRERMMRAVTATLAFALLGVGSLLRNAQVFQSSIGADADKEPIRLMPPEPKRAPGQSTPITYTLHVGCESAGIKAKYPNFFNNGAKIVEARLVYHNFDIATKKGAKGFFEWDAGIPMPAINLQPGDTNTFSVRTNMVNYEYGYAIKNSNGDIAYEIGDEDNHGFEDQSCLYGFGKWRNRVITRDARNSTTLGFVDAIFATCNKENCMPGDPEDPWSWDAGARERGSDLMKTNPPKGLNGQFMMFGVNKGGICTMNLHTQRGTCDDTMVHFDPRPKENRFITDNSRCGKWQGQYEILPWKNSEMGSVKENDNTKYKFIFQYHKDGLNILLNGKFYHKYGWSRQDTGYNSVSYIQVEFLNDKHYRQGQFYPKWKQRAAVAGREATHECTLVALMPPRTAIGAAAFDDP